MGGGGGGGWLVLNQNTVVQGLIQDSTLGLLNYNAWHAPKVFQFED